MPTRQFGWSSLDERRGADLFLADLLGSMPRRDTPEIIEEQDAPLLEVCGFFGPNDVRRTEQQIRDAVVARANAEWTAWHTAAGAPRAEGEADMFGRLVGYYLAGNGSIAPDNLTAAQAAALGAINYAPLLAATAAATITREVRRVRTMVLASAPGATDAGLTGRVDAAIRQALQGHANTGDFKSWSAFFVVACVRGAAIAEGLEAVIQPGRRHIGADGLLLAALRHSEYVVEARRRRAARLPRWRATYHAFRPAERPPRRGDIIVQDRRGLASAAQVITLAALPQRFRTHADIVVEVAPTFVVTVGGNLTGTLGDSVRRRRYPLDASGLLVVDRLQLFTQEDDSGALAGLPQATTGAIDEHSTARIFALLSLLEECAAVPGQPYHGGVLT